MESDQISTIDDWPKPKAMRDVQVLFRFTNIYRRFIRKYAKVTLQLTDLLKQADTAGEPPKGRSQCQLSENCGKVKWEWTRQAELVFQKLKRTFTEAPILQHFDPAKSIISLQTDARGFAIAGILNQYYGVGVLRPVNFNIGKCSSADQNYDTYDLKQLAIVETPKQWRHYLQGSNKKVSIRCDHKNLEYFQTSKVLSRRQARWLETLSAYNFVIEHLEGSKNPADGPSRRGDYEVGYERPVARLMATVSVEPYDDLMPAIIAAQASDPLAADISAKLVDWPVADGAHTTEEESQWKVVAGVWTYEWRIHFPAVDSPCGKVINLFHHNPKSGHFGALKTTELVSRDSDWPVMDSLVRKYVSSSEVCNRIKAPRHARHRINMPLEIPSRPWEGVTMDFVTDLPKSTASSYTGILVIVDRMTKMAINLPCREDSDSPELARLIFEHVICKRGVPGNIVTDCGTQFTSRFWTRVCSHLSTEHWLSTAFHPQTDGQTESQNQTME